MHTMTTVHGSTAAIFDDNTKFSRLLWAQQTLAPNFNKLEKE